MSPHLLSYLLLACMVGGSLQVCAPDCTGVDPGTFVRDPTDCTRYYVCLQIGGEMFPSEAVECPDGEYFNDAHTVPRCDPIAEAGSDFCSDLCNPCVPDCRIDNPGTVQPDPLDCNMYYVCLSDAHLLEELCPSDAPYFDFRAGNCQTDETLCYGYCDPCVPHCTTDGERIADPTDCHGFYVCSPPDMAHAICPTNGVFDPETALCGDYTCNTICPT